MQHQRGPRAARQGHRRERVRATGVEGFTNALDGMLIDSMLDTRRSAPTLGRLQRRLLREWQVYSLRGIEDDSKNMGDPLPIIWSYYQAYDLD